MLVEQRSEEWFNLRKGKISSSEIHKIMGGGKGKESLGETGKTYLLERVSETLNGFSQPVTGPALEWGTELEDLAIEVYEDRYKLKVDKASFIEYNEFYGGSPDGLIGSDGIIEVKCPYTSANHFKHGLMKDDAAFLKVATNYYYQCMSNIIVAKAKWCDFISFDPRVDAPYNMFVYRLYRNEDVVKAMLEKVDIAITYMQEIRDRLKTAAKNTNNDGDAVK